MVMEHCVQAGAAFVVSPCCYGFVQNAVKFTFPKRFVSGRSGFHFILTPFQLFVFVLTLLLGSCWLERFSLGGEGLLTLTVTATNADTQAQPGSLVKAFFPPISFMRLIIADSSVAVSHHIHDGVSPYHIQYEPASLEAKSGKTFHLFIFFFFFSRVVENSKLCWKSIALWLLEIIKANSHGEKVKQEALL